MDENQVHIPDGWESKSLIQLADYINGYGFKPADWSKDGLPIIRIEQLKNSNADYDYCNFTIPDKYIIEYGDLIFSWSASLFLKIWDRQKSVLNQHLFKVLPFENIDKVFLKYLLDSSIEDLNKNAQGSTMQHITRKELHSFHRKLPKSKTEQTTIARILSKVDEAITQTEQLIAKYTRIKTGLMQDLLTKGIDEHGNIRSEETHEFKDSPLGRIPTEWECEFLGRYVNIMGGYAFKSRDFTEDGLQLIRMGNLYNNRLSLQRDPVFLPKEFESKHSNFVLKNGDLIMSMTGTSGKRDYGFTVEIEIDKTLLLNQRVCKFKFLESRIDKTYLINLFHSEIYLATLYENATGTKQANLNSDNILNIYVPFPSKDEQVVIGEKFNSIDKSIRTFYQELSKLQFLKTGLMQDLLSGKVRVNHLIKETASV